MQPLPHEVADARAVEEILSVFHGYEGRDEQPRHRYLSTACLHAIFDDKLHDACRLTCKYCESECVCPCHVKDKA